jgi:hypothetical protein
MRKKIKTNGSIVHIRSEDPDKYDDLESNQEKVLDLTEQIDDN